ncbi:MAG: class I SAM-dependent methyltransferase [Candidatus Jacksonbacteria bacterium]
MFNTPLFLNPIQILKDLNIEEGMNIADFGAGSGYMTFHAAKMIGKKGTIYALDVNKTVVAHLKKEAKQKNLSNIQTIWTNLEMVNRNPIKPNAIDLVLIVNMLFFESNKYYEVLKEAYRILKPAGRVVIVDWIKQATPFGPPLDERVNLEKLKQAAYNLGLNKIKEIEPGPYHFGLIFKK